MQRKDFIKTVVSLSVLQSLGCFSNTFKAMELKQDNKKMPVLFMGHGSPMNAIEDNEFSRHWKKMGDELPVPQAILCISAHWLTRGTYVTAMENPKTIHDFGGFPKALHDAQYPAKGSPTVAAETSGLITKTKVGLDHEWGLDHGAWSIFKQMYPEANIPVVQLSIDYNQSAQYHYDLAKELSALRKKGVMIVGSGNMVHNLGMVAFDRLNDQEYGYDWALEINKTFKDKINAKDHKALINYTTDLGAAAKLAIPTPDHYYPLIYTLGLQEDSDHVEFFNDKAVGGSITMTSVKIS